MPNLSILFFIFIYRSLSFYFKYNRRHDHDIPSFFRLCWSFAENFHLFYKYRVYFAFTFLF